MTRTRVLHVFKYFRPAFTGEGVFVERLAPVMARLRPDVAHDVLVTATPRPDRPLRRPGLGQIHYLSGPGAAASQGALIGWLARHGGRYRVVHHHTHVDRTFLGAAWLKLHGCRIILSATLDDSAPGLLRTYRPLLRPLVRRLFALVDRFVAISPKLMGENQSLAPRRSVLVPMGIPLPKPGVPDRAAARRALALPAEAEVLVSVGGLCARKDQLFLVRALEPWLRQGPRRRLVLVGPPVEADYHEALRAAVAEAGLEAQVVLAGYAEPWPYYAAADLFVFASREEGFGTVMIEAMAHGLPVVARRLPGVNETFVEPGQTGFLFTEAEEFRGQVERLMGDPALRQRLGARARAAAAARFDIVEVAGRYLALYGAPAEPRP